MPQQNSVLRLLVAKSIVRRNCFRRFTRCACQIALSVLALPLSALPADVRGRITDPQDLPVPNAHIRLFAAGDRHFQTPLRVAQSDAEGRFRIADDSPGGAILEITAPGFRRIVQPAVAERDLAVQLEVAALHGGVVVTADRREGDTFDASLSASVLSGARFKREVALNLAHSLEQIPGVNWVNAGVFRSRPVIRGLDSNRILVLLDGERLNNGRTATNNAGIETSLADIAQAGRVEVVLGPGSVLYGSDAFGGVVNVISHSARPADTLWVAARIRGEFFSLGGGKRAHLDVGLGSRRWSLKLFGGAGAMNDYRTPAGILFGSGVDDGTGSGEVRIYPRRDQSLFFKFTQRDAYNFGFPDLQANPAFLARFPFSKLQKFGWGYSGNFASAALSSLQVRFYRQEQTRDFFNLLRAAPGVEILSDTVTGVGSFGYDVQASSTPSRRYVVTYGSAFFRDFNRDSRIQILNPSGPAPLVLSNAPSVPNSTFRGLGFFVQNQLKAAPRLDLNGGIRVDHFRLTSQPTPNFSAAALAASRNATDLAVSGGGGATFKLTEGWVATANLARAFREPNLFERYFFGRGSVGGFIVPNPGLRPETSLQFDLSTRLHRGPARVSLSYFHNRLTDLITSAPGTFNGTATVSGQPVFQNVNLSRARIQGLEAAGEWHWQAWRSQWSWQTSVAWQRGTDVIGGPLPLIAPVITQLGLRWQPRGLRAWVDAGARMAHAERRVPTGFPPIQAFSVFSARAGYELLRGERGLGTFLPAGISALNLHFASDNLSNRLYRNIFESVPEPGRSYRLGLDLQFEKRRGRP